MASGVQQMLCGQISALLLIADNAVVLPLLQIAGHEHIGDAHGLQPLDGALGAAAGEQQDPVYLSADCGFDQLIFQLRIVPGAEDQQGIPFFCGGVLNAVRHAAVIGVGHSADDYPKRSGMPGAKGAGHCIADVAHPSGCVLNFFTGFGGYIGLVLQRPGYGIGGIAGGAGYILQRYALSGKAWHGKQPPRYGNRLMLEILT